VAFLIYMITTFSLYVPDWSFVDHVNSDEPKRYTVYSLSLLFLEYRSVHLLCLFNFLIVFCLLGVMWNERTLRPCMQCGWIR
jgi:hypothetical protein